MKLGVLFSGGKDSCLALHIAKQQGHEIKYLLSVIPDNFDSFMFHKPYLGLLKKQAENLGIKLIIIKSKGVKDKEVDDLRKLIESVKDEVDGIAVGGIASNYQGNKVRKICEEFGLKFYAPLWNLKSEEVWKILFKEKFKIILTKISSEGIPKEFIGKVIDEKMLDELRKLSEKYKFRMDFEGGEAESAVVFMPGFKKEIKIKYNVKSEGECRHYLKVLEIR